MADKKGIAALIVGKMSPKEEEAELSSRDMAAEDIINAMDQKDPDMLKAALEAFLDSRD